MRGPASRGKRTAPSGLLERLCVVRLCRMRGHPMRKTVQRIGARLAAIICTVLIVVIFRPSLAWGIGIAVMVMLAFTVAFSWLFGERPAELGKQFGK